MDALGGIDVQKWRVLNTANEERPCNDAARRLQAMPSVGQKIALAISAFVRPWTASSAVAALLPWLGLVPRQYASGRNERLERISEADQTEIQDLLIIGAMSRLTVLARKSIQEGSWRACAAP